MNWGRDCTDFVFYISNYRCVFKSFYTVLALGKVTESHCQITLSLF